MGGVSLKSIPLPQYLSVQDCYYPLVFGIIQREGQNKTEEKKQCAAEIAAGATNMEDVLAIYLCITVPFRPHL